MTKEKCANCDKVIKKREAKYLGNDRKILCSVECANIHDENIRKTAKNCSVCGKGITKQEMIYSARGTNKEKKDYCFLECFKKRENIPEDGQNNPPKSPNNNQNKGTPTSLKVFFWIFGIATVLTLTFIGEKSYQQKKIS